MPAQIIAPFRGKHDHSQCLGEALAAAERLCKEKGLRLTPLRRHVLELVWQSHKPARAYDILDQLKERGYRPAPPTAYRALEFLAQAGLIHRIESLNAFVGCADPDARHAGQFFICDECDAIAEIYDSALLDALDRHATELGFETHDQTIEIRGLCARCTASAD